MKEKKVIFTFLLLLFFVVNVSAQKIYRVSGKVLSSLNRPISGAIVSAHGVEDVITSEDGTFQLEIKDLNNQISIWASGFYPYSKVLNENREMVIMMIPEQQYKYNESIVLPFRVEERKELTTSAVNITKKDFIPGSLTIDRALSGQVAGLQVTRSSGMPGEGSYLNLRGVRTLVADNSPLIVINGIPYLPDSRESQLINGFTRNILQSYNIHDIQNITILKGAEASLYGSMGANGVILIETDGASSNDLETKISFFGQYGTTWNHKRMPLLEGTDYKSYLSDIGMTYFDNMENFFAEFPFLDNPDGKYGYLYNNKTDWQSHIYKKGFVTDNLFRVEGGDAIAKYDLSLGYVNEDGILNNTSMQRYHTQLNTNVLVSKRIEMFATVGLAYMNGNFQEQGLVSQTNPILSAYAQSPLLSPYKKDANGEELANYATYYYGNSKNMDFATSNPLAIVNTLDANNRQYDVNVKFGATYKPLPNLVFTGNIGLFYNYNSENLFVPGVTNESILPFFDQFGEARNMVKNGVGETLNFYYNLNGNYNRIFNNIHKLNVLGGMQIITSKNEYDAGTGRNTPNDFYQTLGDVQSIGRYFYGYIDKWNWMNFYGHTDYTYKDILNASFNMAVDGSSSAGSYGNHFFVYPSVGLTWFGKSLLPLENSILINKLNVRAEYALTGNSRFSSNYGKFYYISSPYQGISGIVRANIPNTRLRPEKNAQLNLGVDFNLLKSRLSLSFDYYNSKSTDVIFALPLPSFYGTGAHYTNCGEITNRGIEASLQASVIRTSHIEWILGGNIAMNKSKVNSLGSVNQISKKYSDGASIVTRVGEVPYQFYGYQALGVFSTQEEANRANLRNSNGRKFAAGDIHYMDQNNDGKIDDRDCVALGSSAPEFFGGFFTNLRYKYFSLSAEFVYSEGNKAYNAVRRTLESVSSFENQSLAVLNRWTLEGQKTEVPRAMWGDPMGNNDFSSRWIEDASYLKMRNITFSYSFDKKVLNFFRAGTLYITGENLLTVTNYLGLDPEFSYSYGGELQGLDYAKLMQPKAVKLGVNLKF